MQTVQFRLSEHLKEVMRDKGIRSQRAFADVFGFSTTSVNHWYHGKAAMNADSAELIHEKWPEYPVDWLRGFTDAKNPMDEAAAIGEMKNTLGDCLLQLTGWDFGTYELDFDPNTTEPTYWVEGADKFITSPMLDGWWSYGELDPENDRHFIRMATLTKDGKRLDLPMLAWYQLLQQQVNRFDFEIGQQIAAQDDLAFFQGYGRTEMKRGADSDEQGKEVALWQSNYTGVAASRN